ncbi:hypothetical protein J8TS2_36800 [Lederbergia ruris]|uniref:Uncharacterized protein n=1 Tax=Lederbergia ruris TaxID=217495 RepID=A0ABQ4KN40_9BACI|nr:hypothetical protein J8TS2_36800 [Lederbergia ruris]
MFPNNTSYYYYLYHFMKALNIVVNVSLNKADDEVDELALLVQEQGHLQQYPE